ncbi:aldehyde dehydrogenase family protein [Rhodohalobacter sp. SW132]|uniref:aldehyde dehydrogenase family protein n=1 Tax=Rhodohalobacter sp. SW132 TaxID=2293433 RepID=UPI000E229250|nr:aldehyde dehydrogenase family protein [Rhodohalobacter sp. SW132]REL38006.1 aldehyde dehydrogenase family protein [Rhodohalobacter sp. SW132]
MSKRIDVLKTYKTYVGGNFPRSESGHTYPVKDSSGKLIANACRCTRKDVRDAMVKARGAFPGWKSRSAYNRGQILYRIAEILEGRSDQFVKELELQGMKKNTAAAEVEISVDRLIYYAGWTDKISQVFGSVNPVASSHFNFSMPDPTGVVGIVAPDESPLLGLVSMMAPVIAGGNSALILSSESKPLTAVSFGEVLHASDVPAGVVNILTGFQSEMVDHLTSHMDLNAVFNANEDSEIRKQIDENCALNVKRRKHLNRNNWQDLSHETPYYIMDFQEIKTTWHPVGI